MADIKVTKGQILMVKVTDIYLAVKVVNRQDGRFIRHDIHVVDRGGDTLKCEYLSKNETCNEFVVGVMQWIKILFPEPKGATIEPYDPASPMEVAKNALPKATSEENKAGFPAYTPSQPNCHNVNVGGKNITFATAYAKDILVAEIAKWPEKRRVLPKDIKRMMGWADIICSETSGRINF